MLLHDCMQGEVTSGGGPALASMISRWKVSLTLHRVFNTSLPGAYFKKS